MDETRFQRLVAFTRQSFMSQHQRNWDEDPAQTRLRMYEKVLPENGREEFLDRLIAESAKSKLAWNAVRLIAERSLREGKPMPAALNQWIADLLSDQYMPKKDKRRPRPSKDGSPEANRDWVICGAIHHVGLRFDLPPTRNHAGPNKCCAKGGSACDVVGAAAFGTSTKAYGNTERIWSKRDRLLSYSVPRNN